MIPLNKQSRLEELAEPLSTLLALYNNAGEQLNQLCLLTNRPANR